jgi:hypothetical protein
MVWIVKFSTALSLRAAAPGTGLTAPPKMRYNKTNSEKEGIRHGKRH